MKYIPKDPRLISCGALLALCFPLMLFWKTYILKEGFNDRGVVNDYKLAGPDFATNKERVPETSELIRKLLAEKKVHLPSWYRYDNWPPATIVNTTENDVDIVKQYSSALDDEDVIALEKYFQGYRYGVVIELGATDGWRLSVTKGLEGHFGWRSILLEANPKDAHQLPLRRPDALSIHTAVCDEPKDVHFAPAGDVGVILEFASDAFLKKFHAHLLDKNGTLDQDKVKQIPAVACVPLGQVLKELGVKHVNFFVLDVEGTEASILRTINFDEIEFDAISIETHRDVGNEDDQVKAVYDIMEKTGKYDKMEVKGRNTWFKRKDFIPSVWSPIAKPTG